MDNRELNALSQCPLFNGLTTDEIDRCVTTVGYKLIKLNKGDTLLHTGDNCTALWIVLDGALTTRMEEADGKTLQVAQLTPAMVVAPAFVFTAKPMPVTAEASSPTLLLQINTANAQRLINLHETIRWNFINLICNRVAQLTSRLRQQSLLTVKQRIMQFLQHEQQRLNTNTFRLQQSRQELANMFGIQKNSLQRCLKQLHAEGTIILDGKQITIL